jgi:hypothetical protein
MLDKTTYVVPHPDAISEIVGRETVLLLAQTGTVIVLNEMGTVIWRLIDGARMVQDIANSVCAEYDVSPAEAEADILELIADLLRHNAVVFASEVNAATGRTDDE